MKKYLKYGLPVLVLIGALLIANHLLKPKVVLETKTITLTFVVSLEDDASELGSITVTSKGDDDLLLLGDVLDRINQENKNQFDISLSGSKDDAYGRFILGVNDYMTEDMNTGPWWGYDSTTNQDCVEAGFCTGIDAQPVYDADVFTFTFTAGF